VNRSLLTLPRHAGLDAFALGAGVAAQGNNSGIGRTGHTAEHGGWLPRVEGNPPHHEGTWKFAGAITGVAPSFVGVTKVPALSDAVVRYHARHWQQQQRQSFNTDQKASDATQGALDWQQRVVQYYKKEIASGHIKEMPPLPQAGGVHKKQDYDAFFNGWKPDVEAREKADAEAAEDAAAAMERDEAAMDKAAMERDETVMHKAADAVAEVAVEVEERKENVQEDAGNPKVEESPPRHETNWSFSDVSGPKPEKVEPYKYHNPSTYKPSGWRSIFDSSSPQPNEDDNEEENDEAPEEAPQRAVSGTCLCVYVCACVRVCCKSTTNNKTRENSSMGVIKKKEQDFQKKGQNRRRKVQKFNHILHEWSGRCTLKLWQGSVLCAHYVSSSDPRLHGL